MRALELCVLVSRHKLRASDVVQKRCRLEPRVLYLLDGWFFQLLASVVNVRVTFVDVQHSDYAARVVGGP